MPTRRIVPFSLSVVVALALAVACDSPNSAPPQQVANPPAQTSPATVPSPSTSVQLASDLPPLPAGVNNAARPAEIVKAAYEFAARHPEVLKYVPCFCACPSMGHKSNEDCFIAGRNADGKVTDWENHGMACEVCIDLAYDARQMHNSGASVAEIRAAIDKKYDTYNRPHTQTPMPPKHSMQ